MSDPRKTEGANISRTDISPTDEQITSAKISLLMGKMNIRINTKVE